MQLANIMLLFITIKKHYNVGEKINGKTTEMKNYLKKVVYGCFSNFL